MPSNIKNKPALSFVAILILAISAIGLLVYLADLKGITVWPFNSSRTDLHRMLGSDVTPWLEHAEIASWTPDLNQKPQRYFVAAALSADEFRSWTGSIKLVVSDAPTVPNGVWKLPPDITLKHWVDASSTTALIDAQGSTAGANVWARWSDGIAYIVVYPVFD